MKIYKKILITFQCCGQLIKIKFKNNKILFFMDIAIGLLRESKNLVNMLFPALIIQLILQPAKVDNILLVVFGICLALTIFSILIEFIQRSLSNYSLRALNYLILGLNQKAMNIDLEDYERKETIENFDKAYDGLWNSSDVDFEIFSVILSKTISFCVSAYIFSTVHIAVTVIVIASLLVEFFLNVRLTDKLHKIDREQSRLTHKQRYITDVIFDLKTNKDIVINQSKSFFLDKYTEVLTSVMNIEKSKKKVVLNNDIVSDLINFVRTCVVYVFAVVQFVLGSLPIANFTLFSNATKQMTYAIWQIMQSFTSLFRASNYFEDYLDYINIKENAKNEGTDIVENSPMTIEFKNVSFRYQNQVKYAINNVSFKISNNETVAIVGDNGAGKSTVIKLLMRLYRVTEGDILLNGKSIYQYSFEDYISHFSPVFQDYMLYSITLGENIYFDKNIKKAHLDKIMKDVDILEKVNTLPDGLETPYTKRFYENGIEFSGGEEQKLVIARALAKGTGILILDEPTSALDPLAEYNIYKLINKIRKNHITIFVSHRLSTTRFSNKTLVFDNGQLVEEGTHESLLRNNGYYKKMYTMQTSYYKQEKGDDIYEC